jgi:hypothetical protein
MLQIKPGVNLLGLSPQMEIAVQVVNGVFAEANLDCVITSACDSVHGKHSHHYKGHAVDFRMPIVPSIVEKIAEALGPQFQVINETNHIHVEFDPA